MATAKPMLPLPARPPIRRALGISPQAKLAAKAHSPQPPTSLRDNPTS